MTLAYCCSHLFISMIRDTDQRKIKLFQMSKMVIPDCSVRIEGTRKGVRKVSKFT